MNIIVTGAAGFIGWHAYRFFMNTGHEVVGWDCVESKKHPDIIKVDMLNDEDVLNRLIISKPDIIIHCAGAADVGKSISMPQSDYNGNVTTTHNLLFSLVKAGMLNTKVIFLSSAAVYGDPVKLPITEQAPINPLSPYALHKYMCESICLYMHKTYNMDVKILRIFSAYGEGLRKQIFWDMYKKAVNTGKLCMFGTGDESRDYINIADVLQAINLIVTKSPRDEIIYNIANGEEITIRSATECFAKAIEMPSEKIEFSGEKKVGNPVNWCADISRLKALGYVKSVCFEDGIRKYVKWTREEEE